MIRYLVTGAGGQLGRGLLAELAGHRGAEAVGLDRRRLDVTRRDDVEAAVAALAPDVIVHAAAWTAVDACELDPPRALAVNGLGTRHVAEAARRVGAHVVYVSTDYVFDGTAGPYDEWDVPHPLSAYGRSKWAGEQELGVEATIVRTSWVVGHGGRNFVATMCELAAGSGEVRVVDDQWGSPSFVADLAPAILRLGRERRAGVWHLTNQGETTWWQLAIAVFRAVGADPARVVPIRTDQLDPPRPAPRPLRATLLNRAWELEGYPALPHWEESLARYLAAAA